MRPMNTPLTIAIELPPAASVTGNCSTWVLSPVNNKKILLNFQRYVSLQRQTRTYTFLLQISPVLRLFVFYVIGCTFRLLIQPSKTRQAFTDVNKAWYPVTLALRVVHTKQKWTQKRHRKQIGCIVFYVAAYTKRHQRSKKKIHIRLRLVWTKHKGHSTVRDSRAVDRIEMNWN